jgi:hypothetical protein
MAGFARLYASAQVTVSIALAVFLHSSQQARRAAKETAVEQDADLRGGSSRDEEERKQQCAAHLALVPPFRLVLPLPLQAAAAQRNTRWDRITGGRRAGREDRIRTSSRPEYSTQARSKSWNELGAVDPVPCSRSLLASLLLFFGQRQLKYSTLLH